MTFCEPENPAFSLMFFGVLNVRPPSVLLAKKISLCTGEISVCSIHAVHMLLTGSGGTVVDGRMNSLSLLFIQVNKKSLSNLVDRQHVFLHHCQMY